MKPQSQKTKNREASLHRTAQAWSWTAILFATFLLCQVAEAKNKKEHGTILTVHNKTGFNTGIYLYCIIFDGVYGVVQIAHVDAYSDAVIELHGEFGMGGIRWDYGSTGGYNWDELLQFDELEVTLSRVGGGYPGFGAITPVKHHDKSEPKNNQIGVITIKNETQYAFMFIATYAIIDTGRGNAFSEGVIIEPGGSAELDFSADPSPIPDGYGSFDAFEVGSLDGFGIHPDWANVLATKKVVFTLHSDLSITVEGKGLTQ
jgi:hypothetical protein